MIPKVKGHLPSTKVLKLVLELNRFGNRHTICTVVNMEMTRGEKHTPLVILGAPKDCSMMTFRPIEGWSSMETLEMYNIYL